MSRNYKLDSSLGSIQSNIIFDGSDTLPKEMMLETTLKVFDYSYDIFEVLNDMNLQYKNQFSVEVQTFKISFLRSALMERDLNQRSMLFLGREVCSLNPFPD